MGFKIVGKDRDWGDFTDLLIEAVFYNDLATIKKQWTTKDGSIIIGTEEHEGTQRTYAAFSITSKETANLPAGRYNYEMAITSEGEARAIGKVEGIVYIKPSIIKDGFKTIEL